MSEQGTLRRQLLFVSAGLTTAALLVLAYQNYAHKPSSSTALHRSNAVRRPRRRWRRGHEPQDFTTDPVVAALRSLNVRMTSLQGYDRYNNQALFNLGQEMLDSGQFDLLPQNLGAIYRDLIARRDMTDGDKQKLNDHIESVFIQNFLQEEFPAGYIIGDDVESMIHALHNHGIAEKNVRSMVQRFDSGKPPVPIAWDLQTPERPGDELTQTDGAGENVTPRDAIAALGGALDDDASGADWGGDDGSDPGGSQGMLDLLYHIAGEQAKREGLVHRGVECNSCGAVPIRGIRYHCANCFDYDLCETCEAQQVHHKSHVFYKIRVPAPSRGHIKQVAPVWYPGNPNAFPSSLSKQVSQLLTHEYRIEKTELDSLYEQFKCLAGHSLPREQDSTRLGMAIDRKGFDAYFTTTSADRPPPQNLLYDRIFAYYDYNNDDLITFEEFVRGMTELQDRTRAARVKRIFRGYDLDNDGYVDRRDFLRMFRAYYAYHKEINREMIMNQDDLEDDVHDAVRSSHPISQAFGWSEFAGHVSRGGQDKQANTNGDLFVVEGPDGVLANETDFRGDRTRAIENIATRGQTRAHGFRSFRQEPEADEPVMNNPPLFPWELRPITHDADATEEDLASVEAPLHVYGWPPVVEPIRDDFINALGAEVYSNLNPAGPSEDILDPVDRARVIYAQAERMDQESDEILTDIRRNAVNQRWRRRQFYTDEEEGMTKPPGYTESDSSEDSEDPNREEIDESVPVTIASSRRHSMRSRSSSKVRFDDSAIDTDYETRSNTSSRSIPANERWGGFELSEQEKDIGKEILYQAVQQGLNELLDPLFKQKEDEALQALSTKSARLKWKAELDAFEITLRQRAEDKESALRDADMLRTEALFSSSIPNGEQSLMTTSNVQPELQLTEKATSEPLNDASDTDHIGLMFDNNTTGSVASSKLGLGSSHEHQHSDDDDLDPTLPHNRPNSPFTAALLIGISHSQRPASPVHNDESPPPEATLTKWLKHRTVELDAKVRGGYGKLSFREFTKKMVQESINHMTTDRVLETLGEEIGRSMDRLEQNREDEGHTRRASGRFIGMVNGGTSPDERNELNMDTGEDDDNDDDEGSKLWNSTADLGRLSFLGSWLEMAQF